MTAAGLPSLLFLLLVLVVVIWLVFYVLRQMPIPQEIRVPIVLLVGIIILYILLTQFGLL